MLECSSLSDNREERINCVEKICFVNFSVNMYLT